MKLFKVLPLIVLCSLSGAISFAQPAAFDVTGSGSYCQGEIGVIVGLTGSETDVTYTLYKNGEAQSLTVPGTGGAIDFGHQLSGTYTVTGTSESGMLQMNGEAVIVENATPLTPVITVADNCGSSTLSTNAEGSLLWSTGATTSSITVNSAGTYSVTTTVNGCISPAGYGTAAPGTVPPTPAVTVVNNCGSSTLSTNAEGSLLWSTGATTSSITVNSAGTYSVTTTVNGCISPAGYGTAAPGTVPPTPAVTVVNNCGSSTLSTNAEGSLLWSTGATTSSITVNSAGTYSVTTTVNGCISPAGYGTAAPGTVPATPAVTVVNNCGSSTLSTNAEGALMWSTGETTSSITVNNAGTYSVTTTVDGCTSSPGSGTAAPRTVPATPVVTVENNCESSTLSTTAVGSLLWSTGATTSSITVTSEGIYTVTTTVDGCTSSPGSGTATPNAIPSAPQIAEINQPTCLIATGSVQLTGLPSTGTWTLTRTPGGTTTQGTGTSSTIPDLAPGIYSFTVATAANCISAASANVTINAQPPTPATPVIGTITHPTCEVGTGSVVLNGLPATGTWIVTRYSDGITTEGTGASTTVTGLAAGTYTFTVTNTSGCISTPTENVVINANPQIPSPPVIGTITQPDCNTATGSVALTGLPEQGTWLLRGSSGNIAITGTGRSTTVGGLQTGTYTFTVTLAGGCTSAPSGNIVINAQPSTPSAPVAGNIIHPTCTRETGTVSLSGLPSTGTWTLTRLPAGITAGGTGSSATIPGLLPGTHTFTVTNEAGCTSPASSGIVINARPPIPAAPVASTQTHPTCTNNTGTAILEGLPAEGSWSVTRMPGASSISGTGTRATVSAIPPGRFSFTVTNSFGCTSAASNSIVVNNQPPTPTAPQIGNIVQPTLDVPTGSITINGLPETGTWTLTRNPGRVSTSGTGTRTTISGLGAGIYTFSVTNAFGCNSVVSNPAGLYSLELYGPENMALKPNDTLKISSSEAGSMTISVSSNSDWSVTDNSLWFKAVKDGNSSITVTYLENISAIDKTGALEVKYTSNPEFVLNIQHKARVSQLKPSKFEDVYLYPNPADDFIYIRLGEEGSGKLRVTITNIQGFIVSSREYDNLTNDQIIEINITGLPSGQYLINIADNIDRKTFRVIKH